MKVNIYVSDDGRFAPRYGFLPPTSPKTLLPRTENWKYVRSADTREFNLPEAVEEEIARRGFWAHTFGGGYSVS